MSECKINIYKSIDDILGKGKDKWFKFNKPNNFIKIDNSPEARITDRNKNGVAERLAETINKKINKLIPIGSFAYATDRYYSPQGVMIRLSPLQLKAINERNSEIQSELLDEVDIEQLEIEQDISFEKFRAKGFYNNDTALEEQERKDFNNENSLFGLDTSNRENLEFHVNTLNIVGQFLENVGIEQKLVPEFLSEDGNIVEGAIAAANFMKGTVEIIEDINKRPQAWNKLPEEAAHWWYRLLDKNSELKNALLTASLTDRKEKELRESLYGNLYDGPKIIGKLALDEEGNVTSKPALSPIREEAIGQLIAESIKRLETSNSAPEDYSFFKKFLDWINSIVNIFRETTHDPFEVAAMKILSSDMSDLMTWKEYRKLNNIVNFADVLTEQSVAPIDYTLIEDKGFPNTQYSSGKWALFNQGGTPNSPLFNTKEELDNWVREEYGKEHDIRQKQQIQEVRDNQIFFDRLLNKTFRKKSRFLPKTLRKYFNIIDTQNLKPLNEWDIESEMKKITKKLTGDEKNQMIQTRGYTNIAPTLKVLPNLLIKYKKNPIVLSEDIKIDGAKKQELSILNGIKNMIKLENPNLKTIKVEEFVAEAHNWLETNYLLGFANENSYLSYRTDQTFAYLDRDRYTNDDYEFGDMTEEQIQALPIEERQRIANILGLTKQNPDVYHNKVSLRFNDMYHLKSGHFEKSPSAWGNLTYFYSGKNKNKDAVLLHEIQNDNIEFLREYKAEKVDLETSLGRYLQQLNIDLLDNITQIETGSKKIQKTYFQDIATSHGQLHNELKQIVDYPFSVGLNILQQNLNEKIELFKAQNDFIENNPEKAQEEIEKLYSKKRKFNDLQKRGGIKSLLKPDEIAQIKESLIESNLAAAPPNELRRTAPLIKIKKDAFKLSVNNFKNLINQRFKDLYGEDNLPLITLEAPAKALSSAQRNAGSVLRELNENVDFLFIFSEKQINTKFYKAISEAKRVYVQARNAKVSHDFNLKLSKINYEQFRNLIENYKYNEDLLQKLINEQAEKNLKEEEIDITLLSDEEIEKDIIGNYEEPNEIDGYAGSTFRYKNIILSFNSTTKKEAVQEIRDRYNPVNQKNKLESEFKAIKEKALEKKEDLEKNYGKIEEEVKNILEVEMNYFTPLVHHLIQKHINSYGKDFPMYFSGYNITQLTQGNDRTALIYAGKDEIDIVNKNSFRFNNLAYDIRNSDGAFLKSDYSNQWEGEIKTEVINQQEYDQAYQQATERRAKEIKFEAAKQIGLIETKSIIPYRQGEDISLEEGIKRLNEYKRQSRQNVDRVVNTIMNINNNKPIETGAIYNAMSQISGIKLIWQDSIPGLKGKPVNKVNRTITSNSGNFLVKRGGFEQSGTYNTIEEAEQFIASHGANFGYSRDEYEIIDVKKEIPGGTGGYLVDLTNYNYNVPILYGIQNNDGFNTKPDILSPERTQAIEEVFNNSPELANIGTTEQYSQYLDTIFPDSKVKDIVYHGTDATFEKFMKMYNNIHFGTLKAAKERLETIKKIRKSTTENIYPVILNIEKPIITDADFDWELDSAGEQPDPYELIRTVGYLDNWLYENGYLPKEESDMFGLPDKSIPERVSLWKNHDSYLYKNFVEDKGSKSYSVFEPEQIHVLASKLDIKGFKDFMAFENSEFSNYGTYQQFRDFIINKSSMEIENKLIKTGKIDRVC